MLKITFRNFLILLLIVSLAAIFNSCGKPILPPVTTGIISGQAAEPIDSSTKDITGYTPIANAEVTIVDADGVTHTVITDENGSYSFDNLNININTVITITKETGEGVQIFKDVVHLAVSQEENYDAGIADALSTATALVVEELVNLGQVQEEIDLDEIASSEGFDELKEDVRQAQEDNQDVNTVSIIPQAEEIADNMVNPPTPAPAPTPQTPNSAKEITSYKFEAAKNTALTSDVLGTVDSGAYTIALTASYGTDLTALVATFELSASAAVKVGSTTQARGTTANDFTSPVTYTVTAEDGSTQDWVVTVNVAIGPLDHFTIIGYPATTTAGENFGSNNIVITAYDGNNKVKIDYTGQVYFTSADTAAMLPYTSGSKYTFTAGDNGIHTFPGTGFTLKIAGSKTITLTDGTVSIISSGITIRAATKSKLLWVTQPASSVAVGTTWDTFTIEITDAYGNRTSDTDEVTIDPSSLTLGGTLTKAAANGLAIFGDITRRTAGTITLSASASGLTATPESDEVTVSAGTADYFKVTGTASMTAGGENAITLTAYDQYNNVAAGYSGDKTLTFSGASSSADPVTSPTCSNKNSTDINFASDTVITFTDGVGPSTMKLYMVEEAHIKATQGTILTSDSNDLDVTVSAGSLNYVKVEDTAGGTGSEVTTHSMTADDTFTVYAAGYDAYGNYKNDESVTWTGTDICLDKLSPTSGTSTTFTPTTAGEGTIVIANYDSITGDTTGTITVSLPPPVHNQTKGTYYNTITEAFDASDTDETNTIVVADGTYYENIFFPNNKVIVLKSENGASSTEINAVNNNYTVVMISNCPDGTTLDGFTITGGSFDYGGGIYISNSSPTIKNNIITGNNAINYSGGGIYIHNSSPTIQDNTITGNNAMFNGGGIYIYDSSPTIKNNTISGNDAKIAGGGIYIVEGISSPTIGGETAGDTSDFNTICNNFTGTGDGTCTIYNQVSPNTYPNNYICID